MTKRKAVSTRTRFDIFKRDGFTCQYCGSTPPAVILHVDHIIPVKEGGGNEETNLTTACDACNMGKAANLLSSVPRSLAERASETAEREAQLRGFSKIMRAKRNRVERDALRVSDIYVDHFGLDGIRKEHVVSIKRFLRDLDVNQVAEAMESAVVRVRSAEQAFRYFCGTCWRIIKEPVTDERRGAAA